MKTIEEKATAYDEALKKIKECTPDENGFITIYPQEIFPELKESESEKIRKEIISALKNANCKGVYDKHLAWLENQAQKPTDMIEPKFKVGYIITNGKIIAKVDENENNKYHGWFGYDKDLSVHYADIPDVENWHLWTIQDAKDGDIICSRHNTESFEWIGIFKSLDKENKRVFFYGFWHDMAKTFSVCRNEAYVLYDDFSPATKEQRDTLMKAMADAGYEWNVENKQLKKIEQESTWNEKIKGLNELETYILSLVPNRSLDAIKVDAKSIRYIINKEQNSAWSEEDAKMLQIAINACNSYQDSLVRNDERFDSAVKCEDWLKSLKDKIQPQIKKDWGEEDEKMLSNICDCIKNLPIFYESININGEDKATERFICDARNWLKSLKDRYTWKPSEEQMKALWEVYKGGENQVALASLYSDLKKLRKE